MLAHACWQAWLLARHGVCRLQSRQGVVPWSTCICCSMHTVKPGNMLDPVINMLLIVCMTCLTSHSNSICWLQPSSPQVSTALTGHTSHIHAGTGCHLPCMSVCEALPGSMHRATQQCNTIHTALLAIHCHQQGQDACKLCTVALSIPPQPTQLASPNTNDLQNMIQVCITDQLSANSPSLFLHSTSAAHHQEHKLLCRNEGCQSLQH